MVLTDLDGDGALRRMRGRAACRGYDAAAFQADFGDYASVPLRSPAVYARYGKVHVIHVVPMAPTGLPGHGLLNARRSRRSRDVTIRVNLLAVYGIKAFVPLDRGR
ncbi:MAG: hypothetical protein U0W40_13295 [Acidimicrobiia bacterium]